MTDDSQRAPTIESAEEFAARLHHAEVFWRDHWTNLQTEYVKRRDAQIRAAALEDAAQSVESYRERDGDSEFILTSREKDRLRIAQRIRNLIPQEPTP